MKFRIDIDCGNAAFGEGAEEVGAELVRLLRELIARIDAGELDANQIFTARDANGNRVGSYILETD